MRTTKTLLSLMIAGALASPCTYAADDVTLQDLYKLIQKQQTQIKKLQRQVNKNDSKIEATATQVEQTITTSSRGGDKTSIGGYGELHYNNLNGEGGAADLDRIDFHRFVLYFGHQFSDSIRFFSELEIEHDIAGAGQVGEVEVEQAYIEIDINQKHKARVGMMLAPVGIMNETHEPTTFYGTERNPVEANIIPATWWYGGVSLLGELSPGWSYEVAIHEGLNTTAGNNYKPRNGRQKTGEATANDLAFTGRIKWTGMPGVEVAATFQHQSDITQGLDNNAGSANLFEVHGIYNTGPFTIKALYAKWDLDGTGPAAIGADEQEGWYIEPSYKFNKKFGVFARWNQYDNAAGDSTASEKEQWDIGVNWWLHPNVVIKADYQRQDNDGGSNQDGINLGIGYMF